MISVKELDEAKPQQWRDAADDALRAAKQCTTIADYARDEIASTVKSNWSGEAGRAARAKFVKHADDYEAAEIALKAMANAYDDLAEVIRDAQRDLRSGLDYAARHGLKVYPSGRVELAQPIASEPGADKYESEADAHVQHAHEVVSDALVKASRADIEIAGRLRTIEGLTAVSDPKVARQALEPGSPLGIALRLTGGLDGVHRINVPPAVLAAVDRASKETGVSRKLLLATLWQEQQWYQNYDRGLRSPLSELWRVGEWMAASTFKSDKSLGITHMKLETARQVLREYPGQFRLEDGRLLRDVSDTELAAKIEGNPELDVRLSAYLLKYKGEDPQGSDSDKQLFTLYSADTSQVRSYNERYGDESDYRDGDIKRRGNNWDRIEPHIDDAIAWRNLTEKEREDAMAQLQAQTPGRQVSLDPIYGHQPVGEGGPGLIPSAPTSPGAPGRGTPAPSPLPAPVPPEGGDR
ncbi:hypothetical protein [Streptomyces lasiicapitis]|uniref:WXG100 family type VII secretion target n=1 Tax=Streptomyces lasiicapitis TaxID=1923961 RepID=A0ABQ2LIG8_9ACTN|nr:hypothetical protein [Streptomyces lasiicapitis]GGO34711.1 hypothetical protein GCM10012286_04200 [Streptomyces lasiicapitis]